MHPFKNAKVTARAKKDPVIVFGLTRRYTLMYDDKGSGATLDGAFYRPSAPNGYYILGDYAQGNYNAPLLPSVMIRVANDDHANPVLMPPIDYVQVWSDQGSGATMDGSIWMPTAPAGYVALGAVAQKGYDKPDIPQLRCMRSDLVTSTTTWDLIWNDQKSGATDDVEIYSIVGLSTFYAQGNYNAPTGPVWVPVAQPPIIFGLTQQYAWMYDDKGSGASMDGSFYRPTAPDGYYILGDYAQGNYDAPASPSLVVKVPNDDPSNPVLKPPTGYNAVWNDKGSGGDNDGSIWTPVAPAGYVTLGAVAQSGYDNPGTIPQLRCMRADFVTQATMGGLIWDDKGSGADEDVEVYAITGMSTFYAQGNYDAPTGSVWAPTATVAWHGVGPRSLGCPAEVNRSDTDAHAVSVEPSGLTRLDQRLYLVSDSGVILTTPLVDSLEGIIHEIVEGAGWLSEYVARTGKENDFECIAQCGSALMVGVEGFNSNGEYTYPHIQLFTPSSSPVNDNLGSFSGSEWELGDFDVSGDESNSGMEGLTFVPDGCYPSSWLLDSPNNPDHSTSYKTAYGGIFFVATQSEKGCIRVYDLPQGNGGVQSVTRMGSITSNLEPDLAISDLYFDASTQRLFVLYDGSSASNDQLQILTISATASLGSGAELNLLASDEVPYDGCEGILAHGNNLYLGVDLSSSQMSGDPPLQDGVYFFSNIIPKILSSG